MTGFFLPATITLNMKTLALITVASFLFLSFGSAGAMTDETTQAIDIWPEDHRYWQYRGEPVMLLGGSVEDNLYQIPDLEEHLDTLAAAGGNYVRCVMSCRDEGNVWPFARDGDLYDLERWNEEHWRRFATCLEETEKRGIIVQIEVWATFDFYRGNWARNPFNPVNNVNYTAEETGLPTVVDSHPVRTENNFFWSVPAEKNVETVLKYQRRFVDKLLSYSLQHDNVLYCMDNETSVTPEWGWYWARHIRRAAEEAGKKVHTTEMWDPHNLRHEMHSYTFDHPELFTFCDISQNNHQTGQTHYDNALWARERTSDPARPLNTVKTYGGEGPHGSVYNGVERFWRHVFAGIAAARFHRPPSGIGLNELAQKMIRGAREVTDAVEVWRCEPAPQMLSDREENEAYCIADPGRAYAVYFPDGGRVTLDLLDAKGELALRWYDIDGGAWGATEELTGGQAVPLAPPSGGRWAAVIK